MNYRRSLSLLFIACVSAAACGDDTGTFASHDASPPDASAPDGGGAGTIDGAATSIRGIAVVQSDYQSSSVSLIDRDGTLLADGCFNSGTKNAGATLTLSGDVVLPTQMPTGGAVIVVDRGNAVLTWLDPATCAPLGQLSVGTGFLSYPHDYVELSPSKAYVTRYSGNATPTPATDDFDDGNDLLIVDPIKASIVGRIDLKPYASADVLPRADRAMLIDGKVFVSLNAIDASFKVYGTGRIVIVDPATDTVVGTIDLPGARNCGALAYAAAAKRLFVACTGDYSDGANQAATSMVLAIDVAAAAPKVVAQLATSTVGGTLFSNGALAALDGSRVVAVSLGDLSNMPPDRLWSLSSTGLPTKIFESTEAFAMGAVLADVERNRVFVADGPTQATASVRIFDDIAGTWQAGAVIKTNPTGKLPPRSLAWY